MNKEEFEKAWNKSHNKERQIELKSLDTFFADGRYWQPSHNPHIHKNEVLLFNNNQVVGWVYPENIRSIK
jgi:hypothetical protein